MKNKIKATVSLLLCVVFICAAFVPCISAYADGREITASATGDVSWTLYDDGELYISYAKSLIATSWKEHFEKIKKIRIGADVKLGSSFDFYFNNATGYCNLESVTVDDGNGAFFADENGILYSKNKTKLYLFPSASGITEFTVPDSVTRIMGGAFCGNKTLTGIDGGKNLKSIDAHAFYFCSGLKSIYMPEGLEVIGNYAFYQCSSLEKIIVPNSLTELGSYAFNRCSALKTAVIGGKMTEIPTRAFSDCSSLETVILHDGINRFDSYAFSNCTKIKDFYFNGSESNWCAITTQGGQSTPLYSAENFYINGKLVTDFVVPSGIEKLPSGLFSGYKKLKSLTISDTVTEIGASAFCGCSNLACVKIPDSVTVINKDAFKDCVMLSDIRLSQKLEYVGSDVFTNTAYYNDPANWDNGFLYLADCLLAADKNKVLPECKLYSKTRIIAQKAFRSFDNLTSVTMNDGLEYIGSFCFESCRNLSHIVLPEGLKSIGYHAFAICTSLQRIDIPESVEFIEDGAFSNCIALTAIEIPAKVKVLETTVIFNCTSLEKLILNEGLEEIGYNAFSSVKIPIIEIPSTVKKINRSAFVGSKITDVYYGNTKADWKRATEGAKFEGITVHYTLKSGDGSVIINHTDANFGYESGNVHLVVEDMKNVVSHYEQNGFYTALMVKPIQVLDIKLVDGDGNPVQPLQDESITVKIKASEDFMNLLKSELKAVSGYDVDAEKIGFAESCLLFENDGKTISVQPSKVFLDKIKIIHWYSDAVNPKDHKSFTHGEITVENGYIILETNHFSEYAVCTDITEPEKFTVKWVVDGVATEQTVTEGDALSAPANPEKEGCTFVGWTPEIPEKMPAKNLEFTAQWQVNEYTITFDTAGGSEIDSLTLGYGAAITPPENPEKEGYTFIGWSPEIPETMPANNLTVVAQYEKNGTSEEPEKPAVTLTGIDVISPPFKTQYVYKVDSLDLSGITVKLEYSDGTSKILTNTDLLKAYGFNVDSVGTKKITVAYGSYTDDFEITVSYSWWQWIIRIVLLGFMWY